MQLDLRTLAKPKIGVRGWSFNAEKSLKLAFFPFIQLLNILCQTALASLALGTRKVGYAIPFTPARFTQLPKTAKI